MIRTALILLLGYLSVTNPDLAYGVEVKFSASVQSDTISLDESISLKLHLEVDSNLSNTGTPSFSAPQFEVINEISTQGMSSSYQSGGGSLGKIVTKFTRTVTKILRPLSVGDLKISNIQVKVGDQTYKADVITVKVLPSGAQPSRRAIRDEEDEDVPAIAQGRLKGGKAFFIKAETNKSEAYKGEQVIVSYYLYRQVRVFNMEVVKYPLLKGFLREDLELPILQRRLGSESTVLDGVPYTRSLLIRYAAYPLKAGELKIDPMGVRLNYYATGGDRDQSDPFSFFQNLAPQVGRANSEPIKVTIKEIPLEGRPQSYTGGVGSFKLSSAVDKYSLRVNEVLSLKVSLEGRGNVTSISSPAIQWGDSLELFDSTENSRTTAGGIGEKIFEYFLIPRKEGKVQVPGIEFSYFDPSSKKYVSESTAPIELEVAAPLPGSEVENPSRVNQTKLLGQSQEPELEVKGQDQELPKDIRYILPPSQLSTRFMGMAWYQWLYVLDLILLLSLIYWIASDRWQFSLLASLNLVRRQKGVLRQRRAAWTRLRDMSRDLKGPATTRQAYAGLVHQIIHDLEHLAGVPSKGASREVWVKMLQDRASLSSSSCKLLKDFLNYADGVQYSGEEESQAMQEAKRHYPEWLANCERLVTDLEAKTLEETRPS